MVENDDFADTLPISNTAKYLQGTLKSDLFHKRKSSPSSSSSSS
jgi:hypothetical protein